MYYKKIFLYSKTITGVQKLNGRNGLPVRNHSFAQAEIFRAAWITFGQ
jgi:hypothetical protein